MLRDSPPIQGAYSRAGRQEVPLEVVSMGRNSVRMLASIFILTWAFLICSCGGGHDSNTAEGTRKRIGTPSDTSRAARYGGQLVIGIQQEPEMLSEMLSATAANNLVCNLIFSKFVKYNSSLRLIPDLIEEIPSIANEGISPDHLTYTYHIRKDAYWHDGFPVTSRDVAFTYRVIMNPLVNVESREGWDVVDAVQTPDEKTVVFHLKRAYPDFVGEAFYDEAVLPEHILKDYEGKKFNTAEFHHSPIGSGPFKFKEWVKGSHLVLERNDDYYENGPYLDRIIFKFIPDMNTLLVQLKTKEIDFFASADINFLKQLEEIPGVRVYKTPMLMYEHVDLNTENPILQDKRVRQALSYATNKKEIAEKVYDGSVQVADLDEFPASKYFNRQAAAKAVYDPLKARMLLHQAGWIDSDSDGILEKDGRKLVLTISATSGQVNRERTEVVLMDQYKKVGVDLKIRNYNSAVIYGTYEDGGILKRGKYDLAMYAWLSSPEPASKEAIYSAENIPPKGQNNPRIKDERLSVLLKQGSNEVDEKKRIEIYKKISEILVDEAPVIPLFWYTSIDACTDRLRNLKPNPTQSADTWNANEWYLVE
jgi:peptide/nickel transport system substrate-binding protein